MANDTSKAASGRGFFYWPLLILRALLFPLYKIPFVLVMIALGYYALCINDQGQDMMASFTAKSIFAGIKQGDFYLALFDLFLVCWAISIWNVSRVLLAAANFNRLVAKEIEGPQLQLAGIMPIIKGNQWVVAAVDDGYKKAISVMIKWTPRILAMLPYLIFIKGYRDQNKAFNGEHWENIWTIIVIAILHMLYFIYRFKLWEILLKRPSGNTVAKKKAAYDLEEEKNFVKSLKKGGVLINSILTVVMTIIMYVYALNAAEASPNATGKPGLIILTAFTVYTLVGLLFNLLINRFKIPIFFLLVALAIFSFSKWNNNHTVQTLGSVADRAMIDARNQLEDTTYFDYWLRKKMADGIFSKDSSTIFIVAAEGGGIRNCYWTYKVLSQLQKLDTAFYAKTFAVTGVSGGSIGLGFYYNYLYYHDALVEKPFFQLQSGSSKLDSICSADYLSRVTFGFLFPDYIQRFLPFPINSWDRSKYLANSFDDGFSSYTENKSLHFLSNNFLKPWSDTNTAYRYPAILFNTIFNEAGKKAIYSPFKLSNRYYADAMDILAETNRSVPMKEAMVSSARFPILTAPGLLWRNTVPSDSSKRDSIKLGHISDGGGFENTGIQTAEQTAMMLQQRLLDKKIFNLKVKIIYIGTGIDSIEIADVNPYQYKRGNAINKSYEIAWLNGATQTLFGWIRSAHNISVRLNPEMKLLQFGLSTKSKQNDHRLPLGWFLSDTSRRIMSAQADTGTCNEILKKSYDNFKTLKKGAALAESFVDLP